MISWVALLSCGHTDAGESAQAYLPEVGDRILCEDMAHGLAEVFVVGVVDDRPQTGPDGKR